MARMYLQRIAYLLCKARTDSGLIKGVYYTLLEYYAWTRQYSSIRCYFIKIMVSMTVEPEVWYGTDNLA